MSHMYMYVLDHQSVDSKCASHKGNHVEKILTGLYTQMKGTAIAPNKIDIHAVDSRP